MLNDNDLVTETVMKKWHICWVTILSKVWIARTTDEKKEADTIKACLNSVNYFKDFCKSNGSDVDSRQQKKKKNAFG